MLIKVAKVEKKETADGKVYHVVTDGNDIKRSCWGPTPKEGQTIDATIVKKGQYENIGEWKEHTEKTADGQAQMTKGEWNERDRKRDLSIHRQSASDRATALAVAGVISHEAIGGWLRAFEHYYESGEWQQPPTGLENLRTKAHIIQSPVFETEQVASTAVEQKIPQILSAKALQDWAKEQFGLDTTEKLLNVLEVPNGREMVVKYGSWQKAAEELRRRITSSTT